MKKQIFFCWAAAVAVLLTGLTTYAQDLRLWYRQPATKWTESLPIGNGRLGAMIYGGIGEEHLQFNESSLWTGYPRDYQRPGASRYLDTIRRLLFAGQQAAAESLAEQHFMGQKDEDEQQYASRKEAWIRRVRSDTAFSRPDWDDRSWKGMQLPTPDGWETAGLEGVDGAIWFRVAFDLPPGWVGKDLELDLGRIRDVDFTYVNGVLIGTGEGISKKRMYSVKASLLKPHHNVIAIQVLNFDDKGGLTGVKGRNELVVRLHSDPKALVLPSGWKYIIQDENPPALPKYEAQYQPFGDWLIRFPGQDNITSYRRQLDIGRAVASVDYISNGIRYSRDYFASEPQHAIVMHVKSDRPGKVNLQALLQTPHRSFSLRRIDSHTLALYIKVKDGVLKGVSFLHVESQHGRTECSGDQLTVRDADEVTLYLFAATSFVNYKDVSGNPTASCQKDLEAIKGLRYEAILAAHVGEYRRYFDAFHIALGPSVQLPTDERIVRYSAEKDPGLIALYVQYARYLLISSSRPGSDRPANLQGIWNDELTPPWGSKYTTNINLEMNYWPAETLNLSACSDPLFHMMKDLSKAGHLSAENYYGAPGWVLHHNTDLWCGTAPINASNHGIWVTGGAWLCHQIWEHYLFTGDKRFLQEYYPVMKMAATFFEDFLQKDPRTGWLISTPSNSPEHGGLVAGPTMDHQIIRDLFKNCMAASRVLHMYPEFEHELRERYGKIAPNQIGKYGQLQEWMEDKDDTADTHRHISHLWGVYPGTDITWKDSALMKAARQSLIYRGDEGTGWSLAWKVNCWARFRDGDHAFRLMNKLLSSAVGATGEHGGVYPNLFDAHPPFQIDGNFGGAAGIAEMLLQSQDSVIDLLPALPAALPDGEVNGICARGGYELDIKWRKGMLERLVLTSRIGGDCILRYGDKIQHLTTQKGQQYTFTGELKPIE